MKTDADILDLKVKDEYPTDYNSCVNKVGRDGKHCEPELVTRIIGWNLDILDMEYNNPYQQTGMAKKLGIDILNGKRLF